MTGLLGAVNGAREGGVSASNSGAKRRKSEKHQTVIGRLRVGGAELKKRQSGEAGPPGPRTRRRFWCIYGLPTTAGTCQAGRHRNSKCPRRRSRHWATSEAATPKSGGGERRLPA